MANKIVIGAIVTVAIATVTVVGINAAGSIVNATSGNTVNTATRAS